VPEEEKFIRLDGAIIDVEVACYPVTYEGEPAVQIIVKDITEEKAAAQNSRRTQTLFSQLFQNSPVAIVMLSDRGTVVKINRGFEEMFGYSQEELLGKELNQFIVPEGLESEGNDLDTLISSYRVIRLETTRVQKGGRLLTVIIYGLPVHLDETTIGIFGLYVDITERKKVEEELKVRNTELDNFVYKVSHDLRAPLSSILGLVNLASLPGNDDNLKDYIPLVGQKVQQLDHFISDVLSHSKNLKLEVQTDLIDLHRTIHETFTGLSYLKGASEIRKKISISGSDFYSDPWRIGEIFRNLISNAIKYRKLDKTESWIEIEARCTEHAVEISIKDNGIGIPAENQGRVFEMFYRASEQSEGSGLGLYIVKNAVEKLDGVVMVDSEPRLGTTFKVVLPNRIQKGNAIP
jgi:PAS domain S-box-containing protein